VRTAIGFDRERGDQVEVVNLRFAEAPQTVELGEQTLMQQLMAFTRDDILRAIELGVILLLTLIVMMTVVRPLMKQIFASPADPRKGGGDGTDGAGGGPGAPQLTTTVGPDGQPLLMAPQGPEGSSERMLALAQIKGQIKAQSVEKVGNMVQQNPSDSVAVIRSWVHDQPAGA
jgi:flagellar M-ring protein FliF